MRPQLPRLISPLARPSHSLELFLPSPARSLFFVATALLMDGVMLTEKQQHFNTPLSSSRSRDRLGLELRMRARFRTIDIANSARARSTQAEACRGAMIRAGIEKSVFAISEKIKR